MLPGISDETKLSFIRLMLERRWNTKEIKMEALDFEDTYLFESSLNQKMVRFLKKGTETVEELDDILVICFGNNRPEQLRKKFGKEKEVFFDYEFGYDPMVIKHVLLTTEETRALDPMGSTIQNYPKILETDRIARYFNAKAGDVFAIYKSSLKEPFNYRVVII